MERLLGRMGLYDLAARRVGVVPVEAGEVEGGTTGMTSAENLTHVRGEGGYSRYCWRNRGKVPVVLVWGQKTNGGTVVQ